MAKGDIKLIPCIGSVGGVVRDFESKAVITGSYRHTQTVAGTTYSWKCAAMTLTGVVKLVEDSFDNNGVEQVFYRMEGLAANAAAVTTVKTAMDEIANVGW